MRARASSWTWRRTSGCTIAGSTSGTTDRTPRPSWCTASRYGLADVLGCRLRGATAIAAPGCFATAAQLALYPLAWAGLDVTPSLFAVTGSSGAGVQPKATTHHPTRAHNVFAYSVLGHRHEAEMLEHWRDWVGRPDATVRLMTHSGPFVRGIYLTLHAFVPKGMAIAAVSRAPWPRTGSARRTQGRPFVRVLDTPPELTHAVGTNYALIHAAENDEWRGDPGDGRDRQPGQGRRRPGDPGNEPRARPGRARRPDGRGDLSMLKGNALSGASSSGVTLSEAKGPEPDVPALLPVYAPMPLCPVAATARGWWTTDGHEWLDAYGGHAVASTGHSHPDVVRAIADQAAQLLFYSTAVPLPQREILAEELAELCPAPLGRVFFCNSGAEANENALHLARRYTRRQAIVSVRGGWHGRTAATPRLYRRRHATSRRPGAPACR